MWRVTRLTGKRDHIKMRDYMDRRVTSPTWGPPPPCKQGLKWTIFLLIDQYTMKWYRRKIKQLDHGRLDPSETPCFWREIAVAANSFLPRKQTKEVDVKRRSCFFSFFVRSNPAFVNKHFYLYLWCSLDHKLVQTIFQITKTKYAPPLVYLCLLVEIEGYT